MTDDPLHVLAVAVLAKELGGSNDNVESIDAGLDSQLGITHVAANVCQDLGLESEVADLLAVIIRLLGGGGGGELDVVDAECIEGFGAVWKEGTVSL